MPYHHLNAVERGRIQALSEQGLSTRAIARDLNRAPSTISRELRRHQEHRRYCGQRAHQRYLQGRKECRRTRALDWQPLRDYVVDKITQNWSPEQVCGTLWLDHPGQPRMRVSPETIYRSIYSDEKLGVILKPCLRQRRPRRRPWGQRKPTRPMIPNRIGIEHRPAAVDTLDRYGDWEGDLVVGANQQGAILTLVERKSMLLRAIWLPSKHAAGVAAAAIGALRDLPQEWRRTLTFDNGSEFAHHQTIAQSLNLQTYFAHPYSAWERARNENTNGLLRQYLPKNTSFAELTQRTLDSIVNQLNHRPRKKLGYRTPLFHLLNQTVALTT